MPLMKKCGVVMGKQANSRSPHRYIEHIAKPDIGFLYDLCTYVFMDFIFSQNKQTFTTDPDSSQLIWTGTEAH